MSGQTTSNHTENALDALVRKITDLGPLAKGLALTRARNAFLDTLACCVAGEKTHKTSS